MKSLLTAMVAMAMAGTAMAQTWDAADDFTAFNPTNGPWSYGYSATPGGTFTLFTTTRTSGTIVLWSRAEGLNPDVMKNTGAVAQWGVNPGQLALHPGTDTFAVLRFTAPEAGTYSLDSQFFVGDTGRTEAYIFQGTTQLFHADNTGTSPVYDNAALVLAAGDAVDFVVGRYDGIDYDSTPLDAAFTVVPEPATFLLFALGGCVVLFRARRRV